MGKYPDDETRETAALIKSMRLELGLNKTGLQKKLGVKSPNTIKHWEDPELTNEPTVTQWRKLQELVKKKRSSFLMSGSTIVYLRKQFNKLSTSDKERFIKDLKSEDEDK